jgi:hypothetical protein
LPNIIGRADNVPGLATRQAIGYVPTRTLRVVITSDDALITAFPVNP